MAKAKRIPIMARVPDDMAAAITRHAKATGQSVSKAAEDLLLEGLAVQSPEVLTVHVADQLPNLHKLAAMLCEDKPALATIHRHLAATSTPDEAAAKLAGIVLLGFAPSAIAWAQESRTEGKDWTTAILKGLPAALRRVADET